MAITDPKIYGALTAIIIDFSRNVIITIVSGLASYWFIIFVFKNLKNFTYLSYSIINTGININENNRCPRGENW